jgi:uncharacterized protein involved in outer membrane biogenesis
MKRGRLLKRAALAAALVAAVLAALALWIDRALSAPDLKPRIESAAGNFLGRPVTIDGLQWKRLPGVLIGTGFKVYDDGARSRLLVDSPVVEADISILSVFKLAAGVTELRFVSPRVFLRRDADGVWNAARLVEEIAARPPSPRRDWGTLAFNWFSIRGGTVTVEDAGGGLGGFPPLCVQGSGKLKFGRRHAHFPFDLVVRPEGSPASLTLTGSLGGRWRLNAALKKAAPALVSPVWPPAARWTGRWDAELDHDERRDDGWRLRAHAEALVLSTSAPPVDLLQLEGLYRPEADSGFTVVARSSATEVRASGSVSEKALDVDVKSPEADVPTLIALAGELSPGSKKTKGKPRSPLPPRPSQAAPRRLTLRLAVDELRWGSARFQTARAVVRHSTGPYLIDDAAFQALGGSVSGGGALLPGGGDRSLSLTWTASGVDLQQLFLAAGSSEAAAGALNSSGSIVTGLGDRFLPGMNGSAQFDLKDGWFGGLPGLLKVLSRLNLSTLFAEAAGHHRARVPFDEAHAAVSIAGGRVTAARPVVLKNKTLMIGFLGSYDLPARTIDGRVVIQILTVTDEIVKLIPGLRDVLLGGRKSMTPIWAKVTGKAADPNVDVLEGKTIAAPFWNAIKNVLKLPKKIGKDLGL